MKLSLIPDIEGRLRNLWVFWSVKFGVLSGICSGTVAAYEGFKAIDPSLLAHFPEQVMGILATLAILFTFASLIARGIDQPALREPKFTVYQQDDEDQH